MKTILFEAPILVNERNYNRMLYGETGSRPGHRDYNLAAGNPAMLAAIYTLLFAASECRLKEELAEGGIDHSQYRRRIDRLSRWRDHKVETRREEFTLAALEGKEWTCPL